MPGPDPDDRVARLADGRSVGYLDLGPPDGAVVLHCHGGLSSRLDARLATDAANAAGVRVIAPDRPGVGRSDPKPHHTLLRWPDDVVELVDQLGIERFAVAGWSLGGCFAMAVATQLADRVDHLGLVASVIPPDWPDMRHGLSAMDRYFLRWCDRAPALDRAGFRALHTVARRNPHRALARAKVSSPTATLLMAAVAEGTKPTAGPLDDYRIMGRPWGFEPAAITTPTTIWQGDHDDMVPASWGHRLADAIPDATFHEVPGGTHYLPGDHWPKILTALSTA